MRLNPSPPWTSLDWSASCSSRLEDKKRRHNKVNGQIRENVGRDVGAGREESKVRSRCTWNRLSSEKKKKEKRHSDRISNSEFRRGGCWEGGATALWCHTAASGSSRGSVMTPFIGRFAPEGTGARWQWVTQTSNGFVARPPESEVVVQVFCSFFPKQRKKQKRKKKGSAVEGRPQRGLSARIVLARGSFLNLRLRRDGLAGQQRSGSGGKVCSRQP